MLDKDRKKYIHKSYGYNICNCKQLLYRTNSMALCMYMCVHAIVCLWMRDKLEIVIIKSIYKGQ